MLLRLFPFFLPLALVLYAPSLEPMLFERGKQELL